MTPLGARPGQSRNPSASRQSQAREITHKASMLPRMRRRLKCRLSVGWCYCGARQVASNHRRNIGPVPAGTRCEAKTRSGKLWRSSEKTLPDARQRAGIGRPTQK